MRLAIEELKNLRQLLLAERLLNGSTRCDARMSEEVREKDLLDLGAMRQGEWMEEPREPGEDGKVSSSAEASTRHDPSLES